MFAFASPQLLIFTNKGVTVPGKTWCGTAICKKEANGPVRSKGLFTWAGPGCGGTGARHNARVSRDRSGPLGGAGRASVVELPTGTSHASDLNVASSSHSGEVVGPLKNHKHEVVVCVLSLWFHLNWRLQSPSLHWSDGDRRISPAYGFCWYGIKGFVRDWKQYSEPSTWI